MNIMKLLVTPKIRINYVTHTMSKTIHTTQENERIMCNKNLLPYKYIKKANSNYILFRDLPEAFNFWLNIPQDIVQVIKEATDYIVHAAILVDDVQDGTQFRRKLPSANRIYGAPWAINSSMFCMIIALKKVVDLQNPKAIHVFCEEILSSLDGTALDIYWRDTFVCPTEDEYKAMVIKKTGSYFLWKFDLMQLFSEDQRDYRELMKTLGYYYQMRDDFTNLVNLEAFDGKSYQNEFKDLQNLMFCEDITEGRFTLPIIHGLTSSEAPTIRSILVQHTTDVVLKKHCLSLLEKVGSLEYTRQALQHLDTNLRNQIHHFGGNPQLEAFLDELYNWST